LFSVQTLRACWRTQFGHQLVPSIADNGLCRTPFGTSEFLDHVRVRRKHHRRGMARLLRDLNDA
jgi:hypothetical protein